MGLINVIMRSTGVSHCYPMRSKDSPWLQWWKAMAGFGSLEPPRASSRIPSPQRWWGDGQKSSRVSHLRNKSDALCTLTLVHLYQIRLAEALGARAQTRALSLWVGEGYENAWGAAPGPGDRQPEALLVTWVQEECRQRAHAQHRQGPNWFKPPSRTLTPRPSAPMQTWWFKRRSLVHRLSRIGNTLGLLHLEQILSF